MDERRLIINAPFGNYFHSRNAISTYGTFTNEPRSGRFRQVLRTVRPVNGGWINQLGLRNPGIEYFEIHPPYTTTEYITSIHGFSTSDWLKILCVLSLYNPLPKSLIKRNSTLVELNASCPNVRDDDTDYPRVFRYAVKLFDRVIVKIGPTEQDYHRMAQAVIEGITRIHCGNTWPSPVGGISGRPLKPLSIRMVERVRLGTPPETVIIGSGGILTKQDITDYWQAGADYVGCASLFLLPWRAFRIKALARHAQLTFAARRKL